MAERFIVVGRDSCEYCVMALDLLLASHKEHIFLNYSKNIEILEDYKIFHEQDTVPIILSNRLDTGYTRKIGGYTDLLEYLS